jgi:hypothetical protein
MIAQQKQLFPQPVFFTQPAVFPTEGKQQHYPPQHC